MKLFIMQSSVTSMYVQIFSPNEESTKAKSYFKEKFSLALFIICMIMAVVIAAIIIIIIIVVVFQKRTTFQKEIIYYVHNLKI